MNCVVVGILIEILDGLRGVGHCDSHAPEFLVETVENKHAAQGFGYHGDDEAGDNDGEEENSNSSEA